MGRGENQLVDEYLSGESTTALASRYGMPISTVRNTLKLAGVLRNRAAAVRLAGSQGKLGGGMRGKCRVFTDDHKKAISRAAKARGENSAGVSLKPNGYIEITRGEHKGRGQHVVILEQKIGRRLLPSEVAHHVDEDRANNTPENLEVMTRTKHASLHATENLPNRKRNLKGQFS